MCNQIIDVQRLPAKRDPNKHTLRQIRVTTINNAYRKEYCWQQDHKMEVAYKQVTLRLTTVFLLINNTQGLKIVMEYSGKTQ